MTDTSSVKSLLNIGLCVSSESIRNKIPPVMLLCSKNGPTPPPKLSPPLLLSPSCISPYHFPLITAVIIKSNRHTHTLAYTMRASDKQGGCGGRLVIQDPLSDRLPRREQSYQLCDWRLTASNLRPTLHA